MSQRLIFAQDGRYYKPKNLTQTSNVGKYELIPVIDCTEKPEKNEDSPPPSIKAISLSRWKSIGCNDNVAERMVTFQDNMNQLVKQLHKSEVATGSSGMSLMVTPFIRFDLAECKEFVLPYNQLLRKHWKAFCDGLLKYDGDCHTFFVGLISVQINRTVLKMLTPAFSARRVTSLYFLGNKLGDNELMVVADIIEQVETLEALAISHNRISAKVVERVSSAIRSHPNLQRLTLSSCFIGNNKVLLSCIRNKTLRSVDFGSNRIGAEGAYYIAKFLAKAKKYAISRVSLEDNILNDKDAFVLASALRQNKTLCNLDLQWNLITMKGRKILRKALFDDRSLNTISDSNHTCLVRESDEPISTKDSLPVLEDINNPKVPSWFGLKSKLCMKIFSPPIGMSSLCYFEDVPVELMPQVIELIQNNPGCSGRRQAHGLIFDMLRSTPCMFSSVHQNDVLVRSTRKRKRVHYKA